MEGVGAGDVKGEGIEEGRGERLKCLGRVFGFAYRTVGFALGGNLPVLRVVICVMCEGDGS